MIEGLIMESGDARVIWVGGVAQLEPSEFNRWLLDPVALSIGTAVPGLHNLDALYWTKKGRADHRELRRKTLLMPGVIATGGAHPKGLLRGEVCNPPCFSFASRMLSHAR